MADGKLDPIKIQAEIDNSEARWQAGITSVSELSKEEQDIRLGYVPGPDEESLEVREQIAETNLKTFQEEGMMAYGYPISYDLRNVGGKNYITPIKNQGGCGSCVAFGTAATVEGTIRKKRNDPNLNIDLSEAHLFYCIAKSQGRNCSNGWWVGPAMDGCKNTGVVDEDCYPYTAGDQNCNLCGDWQKRTQKISGWHEIRNVAKMKDWLSNHGPLAACFTVYADFYSYRSGIYKHVTGEKRGGHCVCCVGYNDSQKYWIMKNSWGSGWGESGYFKISYGQCGIDSVMWAVDDIEDTAWHNSKKITGLWTINQNRNAYVYISGLGWKKVANDNDNIFFTMLNQLITAKAANRPVNIHIVKSIIKEVYVL